MTSLSDPKTDPEVLKIKKLSKLKFEIDDNLYKTILDEIKSVEFKTMIGSSSGRTVKVRVGFKSYKPSYLTFHFLEKWLNSSGSIIKPDGPRTAEGVLYELVHHLLRKTPPEENKNDILHFKVWKQNPNLTVDDIQGFLSHFIQEREPELIKHLQVHANSINNFLHNGDLFKQRDAHQRKKAISVFKASVIHAYKFGCTKEDLERAFDAATIEYVMKS